MSELETSPDAGVLGRAASIVAQAGGPTAAARSMGVARNTLDLWLKGKSKLPLEGASKLARLGGTTLDWLVHGNEPSSSGTDKESASKVLAEKLPDDFIAVPMLDVQASAGGGRLSDPDNIGLRGVAAFRADWLRAKGLNPDRAHVLTAVGDSMEPTIRNGDFLLIDRSVDRIMDNGIYVVVLAGLVLVKRVQVRLNGALVLKSENPVYGEEVVPPDSVNDMVVEGRVCWFGRGI